MRRRDLGGALASSRPNSRKELVQRFDIVHRQVAFEELVIRRQPRRGWR
jgi:hypothetical protein